MLLKIEKLNKNFDKKIIFNDFSYIFDKNGLYVLQGESGIGKTTLLRIISRLDKDYQGEIVSDEKYRVSYAFQEYRLFDGLSALENAVIPSFDKPSEADFKKGYEILSRLGFRDEEMKLYPRELSGGMKQRVSLARAFLRESDVLLLDEPTKELDEALRVIVREMIYEASKERIVIAVSHDVDEFSKFDAMYIKLIKSF